MALKTTFRRLSQLSRIHGIVHFIMIHQAPKEKRTSKNELIQVWFNYQIHLNHKGPNKNANLKVNPTQNHNTDFAFKHLWVTELAQSSLHIKRRCY